MRPDSASYPDSGYRISDTGYRIVGKRSIRPSDLVHPYN